MPLIWLLTATLSISLTTAAHAFCAPRESLADYLHGLHREVVTLIAITEDGRQMEFWQNAETRTWTISITDTAGRACLMSAGTDFDHITYMRGEDG